MCENFIFHIIFYQSGHGYDCLTDKKQEKSPQEGHRKNQQAENQNVFQKLRPRSLPYNFTIIIYLVIAKTFYHIVDSYPDQLGRNDYKKVWNKCKNYP